MSGANNSDTNVDNKISRRNMLQIGAAGAAALALPACSIADKKAKVAATRGRINQSVVRWCYEKYWSLDKTCQIAKQLGCKSVELVEPKDWHKHFVEP